MLKNKKSAYILLPLTLIIWGLIGYKVYQYLNEGDEDLVLDGPAAAPANDKMSSDSFLVFNNYRDPFLGNDSKELVVSGRPNTTASYSNSNSRPYNSTNTKPPKNQQANVPAVTDAWPKIVYQGMILNSTTRQSMGFVSIDGASTRVKPGDKIGADLKVIQFDQNMITIAKGKEKKTFAK